MEKIRNPRRVSSMMGFGVLGMLVVWYVAVNVISVLLARNAPSAFNSPWTLWLLNDVPLYFLGVPVMLLIFKFIPDGKEPERQKHKLTPLRYLLVVIFCIGCMYTISFPTNLIITFIESFKSNGGSSDGISTLTSASGILQNILFGACVPALGEEFVFRYMFRRKMKGASDKIYILVSAVCFAMFHANFAQIGYAFVLGVVFAWLYTYTGNIWLPVSLHFIANMFGMIIMPTIAGYNLTIYLVLFVGFIGGAIALFIVWQRRVFATWQPPTEAGWPYKPPKRKNTATHYYIDPMTGRPVEVSAPAPQPTAYYGAGYPYTAPGTSGYQTYPAAGYAPPYGAQASYGVRPPYGAPPAAYPPANPAYSYYGQQTYTTGGYAPVAFPYGGAPAAPAAPGPMTSSVYGAPQPPLAAPTPVAAATPVVSAASTSSGMYTSVAPTAAPTAPYAASATPVAPAAASTATPTEQQSPTLWSTSAPSVGTEPAPIVPATPAEAPIAVASAPFAVSAGAPATDVSGVSSSAAPITQTPQPTVPAYTSPAPTAPVATTQPVPANPYGQPVAAAMPPYYAYPAAPLKTAFQVCILNGGMLTYLIATTLLTLFNLFA